MKYAIKVWIDSDREIDKYHPNYIEVKGKDSTYYFAQQLNEKCLFDSHEVAKRHHDFMVSNNPQFSFAIDEFEDEEAFVKILRGDAY